MTSKIKIIFAVLALAVFSAKAQTNLFYAHSDTIKKDIIIGQEVRQAKSFGKDTTAALKAVGEILAQLEQDSAALVLQFRANRSQYAQALQIIAALTPGKPGTPPAETPEQKELRLLREENAKLKSEKDRPKKNR
jgi:hypothetical protein